MNEESDQSRLLVWALTTGSDFFDYFTESNGGSIPEG
jgi:hypothetical protein